jgi:hypothetical protein
MRRSGIHLHVRETGMIVIIELIDRELTREAFLYDDRGDGFPYTWEHYVAKSIDEVCFMDPSAKPDLPQKIVFELNNKTELCVTPCIRHQYGIPDDIEYIDIGFYTQRWSDQ